MCRSGAGYRSEAHDVVTSLLSTPTDTNSEIIDECIVKSRNCTRNTRVSFLARTGYIRFDNLVYLIVAVYLLCTYDVTNCVDLR